MKRMLLVLSCLVLVSAGGLAAASVSALTPERILTDTQIEGIRGSCSQSKLEVERLQRSDRLLRYNLGKQYEWIYKRLMVPLGNRIAVNGLDGVALTATAVEYNQELADFREVYEAYDRSLEAILDVDCDQQPIEYYSAVERAREMREETQNGTKRLAEIAKRFRVQADEFAKNNVDEAES